jgi:hypothetical protein
MKSINWKTKTILIGALIGSLTGIIAALMIMQKAEKQSTQPQLSTGEGVKIGLGVLGLLRLVTELTEGK